MYFTLNSMLSQTKQSLWYGNHITDRIHIYVYPFNEKLNSWSRKNVLCDAKQCDCEGCCKLSRQHCVEAKLNKHFRLHNWKTLNNMYLQYGLKRPIGKLIINRKSFWKVAYTFWYLFQNLFVIVLRVLVTMYKVFSSGIFLNRCLKQIFLRVHRCFLADKQICFPLFPMLATYSYHFPNRSVHF